VVLGLRTKSDESQRSERIFRRYCLFEGQRNANPDAQPGPSLFTALQEQLGLRLESSRVPAEYLIVDPAEIPTSN
jgi:uncharacterized protein (TIGR03435 family)